MPALIPRSAGRCFASDPRDTKEVGSYCDWDPSDQPDAEEGEEKEEKNERKNEKQKPKNNTDFEVCTVPPTASLNPKLRP